MLAHALAVVGRSARPADILLAAAEHDRHVHDLVRRRPRPRPDAAARAPAARDERLERLVPRPAAEQAVRVVELAEVAAVAQGEGARLRGVEGGVADAGGAQGWEAEGPQRGRGAGL